MIPFLWGVPLTVAACPDRATRTSDAGPWRRAPAVRTIDAMPRPDIESPATPTRTAADVAELRTRLEALSLTKTELTVLTARLGLDGTVLTYKEIAAKTGMMPVLIRDLERRVLSRVGL